MKYKFRYLDGLKPIKKSNSLNIGSVLHTAKDMYYNGFSDDEVTMHIVKDMDEQISSVGPEEREDLVVAKYTALGMWMNFPYKNLDFFQEIKSEKEERLKIAEDVTAVFKLDHDVKVNGLNFIGELKTSGLSKEEFKARASSSSQLSLYVYLKRLQGVDTKGVILEYVGKPRLQKRVKENCEEFGYRIANDYKERPDFYYGRMYEYRNEDELKLFEEDLFNLIKCVKIARETKTFYRNQDACWQFRSECPYKKICFCKQPDPLTVQLYFQNIKKEEPNEQGIE